MPPGIPAAGGRSQAVVASSRVRKERCRANRTAELTCDGSDELIRLLRDRPETRLLDVRTPGEFEAEHIAGAYNVPLDTLAEHGPEIRAAVADLVVLVCRSGQRARKAEEALNAAGMTNLHVLDGGMSAWTGADHPVRRGAPRMSLERQVRIAAGALVVAGALLALFVHPLFGTLPAFVSDHPGFSTQQHASSHTWPRVPCSPSRTMIGVMASAATGSAHHQPNSAFNPTPASAMTER